MLKGHKYDSLLGSVPLIARLMDNLCVETVPARRRELARGLVRELVEAYAPFVARLPQAEEIMPLVDDVFDALESK